MQHIFYTKFGNWLKVIFKYSKVDETVIIFF